MAKQVILSEFIVERDDKKCIICEVCVRMCSNSVHSCETNSDVVLSDNKKCFGCHFCEALCPTSAITIKYNPSEYKPNANWGTQIMKDITKQKGQILTSAFIPSTQLTSL